MVEFGVFSNREDWQQRSWLSHRIGDLFYLSHTVVTLWCAVLWLGPYRWMWWGVVILYAATEILWFFRGRFCILSDLERYFKGIPRPDDPLDQNFIRRLWNLLFRRDISSENAQILTRIWGRLGFTVAFARLYLSGAF